MDPVFVGGMGQEGRSDSRKGSGPEEPDFPPGGFLCGSSQDHDIPLSGRKRPGERQRGSHRRTRDEVMPAGMSQLGKRIVFGDQGNSPALSPAPLGPEGGGHAAELFPDPEAGRLQDPANQFGGPEFLEGDFRIPMKEAGDLAGGPGGPGEGGVDFCAQSGRKIHTR